MKCFKLNSYNIIIELLVVRIFEIMINFKDLKSNVSNIELRYFCYSMCDQI